jgi:RNA-binding signal recognition particle 68
MWKWPCGCASTPAAIQRHGLQADSRCILVCILRSGGALEAEAYSSWMAGLLALEKEADWGAALAQLSRAK